MALRMTEEEFAEWQRQQKQRNTPKPDYAGRVERKYDTMQTEYGSIAGAIPKGVSPTCCQPGRAPGVSVADMDEKPKKRQKYGNRRVEIDGMKFDSQHEAAIYQELMLRVRAGELKSVLRQVSFDLPGGIRYVADFVAIAPDFRIEGVYDAKSPATKQNRVYINKKKQMKACWDIEIKEV